MELYCGCGWSIHPNGGGRVDDTAHVDASAYVGSGARVSDNARVFDKARVDGGAWVYGYADVFDRAVVYGTAWVYGNARVYDTARVSGRAEVYENAWVNSNAVVTNDAKVRGNAVVGGNAWVFGAASVCDDARVLGDAKVDGNEWVGGTMRITESVDGGKKMGFCARCGKTDVKQHAEISENAGGLFVHISSDEVGLCESCLMIVKPQLKLVLSEATTFARFSSPDQNGERTKWLGIQVARIDEALGRVATEVGILGSGVKSAIECIDELERRTQPKIAPGRRSSKRGKAAR